MTEKMKILIGYDGSESGNAALDDLKRAGLPDEADVFVASISEMWIPLPLSYGGVETSYVDESITGVTQSRNLAAKAAERVKLDFPGWTVESNAAVGSPSNVLLVKAEDWRPDLIIVGSHNRGALGRFFLGSVSQSVLNHAHCSVRVARGGKNNVSPEDSQRPRIVVGVDGSDGAEAAVNSVIARNWTKGSEVCVVFATSQLLLAAFQPFDLQVPANLQETEFYKEEKARADEIVNRAVQKLSEAGFVTSFVMRADDPKQLLVQEAEEWGADCIFVGATGMSGFERLMVGSVSAAVAARAHCSVEVVRAQA